MMELTTTHLLREQKDQELLLKLVMAIKRKLSKERELGSTRLQMKRENIELVEYGLSLF